MRFDYISSFDNFFVFFYWLDLDSWLSGLWKVLLRQLPKVTYILQITPRIFGLKCILFINTLFIIIIVSFFDICVSQGSAAMQLRRGGIQ